MRLKNILLDTKTFYPSTYVISQFIMCEREIFDGLCMNVVIISTRLLKFGDMVSLAGRGVQCLWQRLGRTETLAWPRSPYIGGERGQLDYYWVFQMFIIPILTLTAENWRIKQQPGGSVRRG